MTEELNVSDVKDDSYWWATGPDGLEVVYCYAEEDDDGRVWYEGRNISARVIDAKDEGVSFHEECPIPVRLKRTPAEDGGCTMDIDLGLRRVADSVDGYSQYRCIKCGAQSGDDWSQCEGKCPIEQSPHFDQGALKMLLEAAP